MRGGFFRKSEQPLSDQISAAGTMLVPWERPVLGDDIQSLHKESKEEDQQFIQAWLRSQYAETIRQSTAGSSNEDFEKIGTRFHSWFRDNLQKMGLSADSSDGFRTILHDEMKYFLQPYRDILDAQREEKTGWERVFYINHWGVARSLAFPLMLAPLRSTDSRDVMRQKINEVARYIETFAVRRSINFKKFGASSIRYTMHTLVKELRGKDLDSLQTFLHDRLEQMEESWDGLAQFRLHARNIRNIVLMRPINSMIEFKQIIGRGRRPSVVPYACPLLIPAPASRHEKARRCPGGSCRQRYPGIAFFAGLLRPR